MSIVIEKTDVIRRPNEFAPMVSDETRAALRGVHWSAGQLYLEVMALPDGFAPSDDWLRARLSWSVTMLRKAKAGLIDAGLYLWEDVRTAAGHVVRVCRYVTNVVRSALSQVGPSAPLPTVGQGAPLPLSREKKKRGSLRRLKPHSPDTCQREADAMPCRQCAKVRAGQTTAPASIPASHPAYQPAVRRPQVGVQAKPEQCEHGRSLHACRETACVARYLSA